MAMGMRVQFGQMKAETQKHRNERDAGRPSTEWLAEKDGDASGDKRRDREERRCARRSDPALRE